jgi:hypothetical protein
MICHVHEESSQGIQVFVLVCLSYELEVSVEPDRAAVSWHDFPCDDGRIVTTPEKVFLFVVNTRHQDSEHRIVIPAHSIVNLIHPESKH